MRTLFTCSLDWDLRRECGAYGTPTQFPTNILYTPVDKHTFAFYIKCVPPVGRVVVVYA